MTLFDSADGILMNHVYQWAAVDLTSLGVVLFGVFALGGLLLDLWGRFRPNLSLERNR